MTHTPTPWQTGGWSHDDDAAVVHAGGAKFAQALYLGGTDQAKANADRIVACANFFHGQDIPTERIEAGGFWEMVILLNRCSRYFAYRTDPAYVPGKEVPPVQMRELLAESRALLAKLGVEP